MHKSRAGRLLSFILLSVLMACSTTKNTFVNRTFHNLSAHYNGLFNATLKLEDGEQKLAASHEDKYDRVLSVFQYANKEKAKAIYPQMDDAIKRTSTVITRHTIVTKAGNEIPSAEKWIDDNWLVYGKALFFKHEYFDAIETFKYIESTYKTEPTRFAASLWLAKCYLELTQLRDAEDRLDYLRNQKDMPKKLKGEYEAVAADFYLQTKNVQKGIDHLKKASILAKKRNDRIRYMFILAQLYQKQNDFKRAYSLYTRVIKMNPVYEMAFNARINRARCYDAESKDGESVKKELLKMKKDPKNKDYFDQIYYALAGIAQKENNETEAIDYLNQSVAASTTNGNQKALSYLELGKIYFAKPDYKKAQAYYDSTITYLGNDYPTYSEILNKRNTLTKLIKYLRTIQLEDSMQQLAKLSRPEQEQLIIDKLNKEVAEEEAKQREKEAQEVNQIFSQNLAEENKFNKEGGSNWYFYNVQAISFGLNEFTKKWGNRKLEDNWRRSNKESVAQEEEIEKLDSAASDTSTAGKDVFAEKKANFLNSIPVTPEAITKSNNKIIEAYYNAGMLYKDQLNDPREAAIMFEELLEKYPKCKYELQCYYQLYRIYTTIAETQKAGYYKNIILSQFGDSEYAEIIRNPNYASEMAGKKSKLEIYYEETYRKYLNGEYASVIQRKAESDILYPQNILVPKFDYLKTLSIGRTQNIKTFEVSLQDIIRNYSNDPVKDQAQDILDYIHGNGAEIKGEMPPAADTVQRLYVYNPDTTQLVIVAFQNIGGPINSDALKNKLSDYNLKYYDLKGYNISSLLYDHRLQIVIVKDFANKDEAVEYSNGLYDNDEVYGNLNPNAYQQFIISANNFPAFIREKKLDDYYDFYSHFYK